MKVEELLEQGPKPKRRTGVGSAQAIMRDVLKMNGADDAGDAYSDARARNRRRIKMYFRFPTSFVDQMSEINHAVEKQLTTIFRDRHADVKMITDRARPWFNFVHGQLRVTLDEEKNPEGRVTRKQIEAHVNALKEYLGKIVNKVTKPYGGKSEHPAIYRTRKLSKNRREFTVKFTVTYATEEDTPKQHRFREDLWNRLKKALSNLNPEFLEIYINEEWEIDPREDWVEVRFSIDDRLPQ